MTGPEVHRLCTETFVAALADPATIIALHNFASGFDYDHLRARAAVSALLAVVALDMAVAKQEVKRG